LNQSKGTPDKLDGALREYLSQQADLLGAIRLPNDAFKKKNANTEVTTDIVMLRKRLPGELPAGPAWKTVGEIVNSLGEYTLVNEYFVAHPEMMLGEMRLEGRMYQPGEPTLVGNGRNLAEQLAEAIALLERDVYRPQSKAVNLGPRASHVPGIATAPRVRRNEMEPQTRRWNRPKAALWAELAGSRICETGMH